MKNQIFIIQKISNKVVCIVFLIAATLFLAEAEAQAQQNPIAPETSQQSSIQNPQNRTYQKRSSLLSQLNLSLEQTQQINNINLEMREAARQTFQRQRSARRALDAAIYADVTDQAMIDERLRELNVAEIEANKMRVTIELRVRQVLTPDQLVRFRELRQNAAQRKLDSKQKMRHRGKFENFPKN